MTCFKEMASKSNLSRQTKTVHKPYVQPLLTNLMTTYKVVERMVMKVFSLLLKHNLKMMMVKQMSFLKQMSMSSVMPLRRLCVAVKIDYSTFRRGLMSLARFSIDPLTFRRGLMSVKVNLLFTFCLIFGRLIFLGHTSKHMLCP